MKLLKEISEKDLDIENAGDVLGETFELRKSARGVLFNDKGEISLQYVSKHDYYKLPGGGVEKGETIESAMQREMKEEVGCTSIDVKESIGMTIEYRNQHNLIHLSYGYIVHVNGEIHEPEYEDYEIDRGFEPHWYTLDKAIELMEEHVPEDNYMGKFVTAREIEFLREAREVLNNGT